MIDQLLSIATHGGTAILWLLIGLSLLSVTVIIERAIAYRRHRTDFASFSSQIVARLNAKDRSGALAQARSQQAAEAQVVAEGISNMDKPPLVVAELMESMRMRQQQHLDQRLGILGTIGSNAPFIGLLGTVLGIIKAFHDLSYNTAGGPAVVMSGIAEALVATAIGLFVAIPAVVFFNYFKGRQKQIMNNVGQTQKMLLAFIGEQQTQTSLSIKEAA